MAPQGISEVKEVVQNIFLEIKNKSKQYYSIELQNWYISSIVDLLAADIEFELAHILAHGSVLKLIELTKITE